MNLKKHIFQVRILDKMSFLIVFLISSIYINAYTKTEIQSEIMNIKIKITKASTKGKLFNVSQIYYDSVGHEIKQINYTPDNKVSTIINKTFDKNGYILSMEVKDKSLLTSKKTTYTNSINKKGQLLTSITNSFDDKKVVSETYIYNTDQSYQVSTKEGEKTINIKLYNSHNKLIKLINLKSNTQIAFEYDKNNHIVKHKELRQGKPTRTITYKNEYDTKNRISSVETGNTIIQYEYDMQDNVKQEIHKNKQGIIALTLNYTYDY